MTKRFSSADLTTLLAWTTKSEDMVSSVIQANWRPENCEVAIHIVPDRPLAVIHVTVSAEIRDQVDEIILFLKEVRNDDLDIGFHTIHVHLSHYRTVSSD